MDLHSKRWLKDKYRQKYEQQKVGVCLHHTGVGVDRGIVCG